MISGIYKLYWSNNSYYYIGQSVNLRARFRKHMVRLRSNRHENNRVQSIYNKYGDPLFEVLEYTNSLDEREQAFLDDYFGKDDCCNMCPTASSTKGYKHTEEDKKRIGALSKLKVYSDEYRARLRARKPVSSMLGRKHTPETKAKMSLQRKGIKLSEIHKRKIGAAHTGPKSYNYGKHLSEETKMKLSIALSLGNNPKAKKVIDLDTGEIYQCAKDVTYKFGINYSTLRYRLQRSLSKKFIYISNLPPQNA